MLARKALAGTAGAPKEYVEDVFSSYLYVGTGSNQTITNDIDISGKGGLVWIKGRNPTSSNHTLYDTERGAGIRLRSNLTNAQSTNLSGYDLTSFTSSGFTLGTAQDTGVNSNGDRSVAWTFRQAKKFFDVVTYTGNGSAPRDISHNLGSSPGFIIIKRTDSTGDWWCWHRSTTNANANFYLNYTDGADTGVNPMISAVSSTNFTLATNQNSTMNINGATYVAYLFAHDAGGFGDAGDQSIIKCGSVTTDGAGNATLDLGWEPQWYLQKSEPAGSWWMADTMRGFGGKNCDNGLLRPHLSDPEYSDGNDYISRNKNGITLRYWAADTKFLYIAIRKGPMKTPETGTSIFAQTAFSGNDTSGTRSAGLNAFDLLIAKRTASSALDWVWLDKMRGIQGNRWLASNATTAEAAGDIINTINGQYTQNGINITKTSNYSYLDAGSSNYVWYALKQAPKFFDIVCYTGNGTSNRAITHNLGVTPELIIVKDRSAANLGMAYAASEGANKFLRLFAGATGDYASTTNSSPWNNTAPTSTQFTVDGSGGYQYVNANGNEYVAWLFSTISGVSKVGSYTGNGSDGLQINCGFTNGARFVMIKRTDSANDWHIFDTARGIVSGSDPYLKLNKTDVEVTTDDIVDTYSSGFIVNAFNGVNANGGTYIYLAIA